MTQEQLKEQETSLHKELNDKIHALRTQYMEEHAEFKVGDVIRNVTGIIKIEHVKYNHYMDETHIIYCGYKYSYDKNYNILYKSSSVMTCLTNGVLIVSPSIAEN